MKTQKREQDATKTIWRVCSIIDTTIIVEKQQLCMPSCTAYGTNLMVTELKTAKQSESLITYDDETVTKKMSDSSKTITKRNDCYTCSCKFSNTLKLPCRHIFSVKIHESEEIFNESMAPERGHVENGNLALDGSAVSSTCKK